MNFSTVLPTVSIESYIASFISLWVWLLTTTTIVSYPEPFNLSVKPLPASAVEFLLLVILQLSAIVFYYCSVQYFRGAVPQWNTISFFRNGTSNESLIQQRDVRPQSDRIQLYGCYHLPILKYVQRPILKLMRSIQSVQDIHPRAINDN
jgi:hypothetical protein